MRKGWNSPGSSVVRERDLETTRARSTAWGKAGVVRSTRLTI
jgi:hypothetical protein